MNIFDLIAPIYDKLPLNFYQTFSMLDRIGDFQKTDRILDLGGGTGRISKFFIDKVQEITVIDYSLWMIKECQKKQKIICKQGNAEKIPFSDNYFDKIIIVDAFHHFQNQELACQEIVRVLKPKGKVLIEEFNPEKIFGKVIKILETLVGMKSNFYYPFVLDQLFEKYKIKTKLINEERLIYYLIGKKY